MHWGFEYHYLPMPYDIMLAHNMIDVGYNTIIGHHPHVVQPFEMYKDKYVFYSIGNFFMGTRRNGFNDRLHEDVHGAGILLENDTFKQFDIRYYMQKTTINEFSGLGNITGIDFKTRDYSKMCRKNAKNYTPILTNNILLNHIKILNLKIIYFIYGQFRFLKKRR
jgi:poly-gamma-glutamate synthesis protein (capsule biosynthesis protein)